MNNNVKRVRDGWIALRCQHGEPAAFAELVDEMQTPLLYFAQKLLGDEHKSLDVLQELWLRVFRSIRQLENPSLVRAWLYQLTRSLAIDRIRKDASVHRREQIYAEERLEVGDEHTFDKEDAAALHSALDTLELRYREVLVLSFLEDMSLDDIAAVVGCPLGTVKSRLYYAKRALHSALQG